MRRLLAGVAALLLFGGADRKIELNEKEWSALVAAVERHCAKITEKGNAFYGCEHALSHMRPAKRGSAKQTKEGLQIACDCFDSIFVVEAAREKSGFRILRVRSLGLSPQF